MASRFLFLFSNTCSCWDIIIGTQVLVRHLLPSKLFVILEHSWLHIVLSVARCSPQVASTSPSLTWRRANLLSHLVCCSPKWNLPYSLRTTRTGLAYLMSYSVARCSPDYLLLIDFLPMWRGSFTQFNVVLTPCSLPLKKESIYCHAYISFGGVQVLVSMGFLGGSQGTCLRYKRSISTYI